MDKRYEILILSLKIAAYLAPIIIGWIAKILIKNEADKSKRQKLNVVKNTVLKYISLAEAYTNQIKNESNLINVKDKEKVNKIKLNFSVAGILKEAIKNKSLKSGLKQIGIDIAHQASAELIKSLVESYYHSGKLKLPEFDPDFKFFGK